MVVFYALDCGFITPVSRASISYSAGTLYNSVASFTCETGYRLHGTSLVCTATGAWSSSPPQCVIVGKWCYFIQTQVGDKISVLR